MKRLFQIGLGILIVGLIALGIGYLNHGDQAVSFNGRHPQLAHQQKSQTIKVNQKFNQIEADVSTADVNVVQGKQFQIIYRGKNTPQIQVKNGRATIRQGERNGQLFQWSMNDSYGMDTVTIMVPAGAKLGGRLHVSEGDLSVSKVTLHQLTASVDEGDVELLNVIANGGKLNVSEGDFMAHQLTVQHHFTVHNEEGDNTVRGISADGYYLRTEDGDNSLFHHERDSDDDSVLQKNSHATNVLTLITSEGDNDVK